MKSIKLKENELVEVIRRVIYEKQSTKFCSRGKSAAKAKYEVYPSAYANGYAVQVCKGTKPGLDGKKKCSGKYCSGKK